MYLYTVSPRRLSSICLLWQWLTDQLLSRACPVLQLDIPFYFFVKMGNVSPPLEDVQHAAIFVQYNRHINLFELILFRRLYERNTLLNLHHSTRLLCSFLSHCNICPKCPKYWNLTESKVSEKVRLKEDDFSAWNSKDDINNLSKTANIEITTSLTSFLSNFAIVVQVLLIKTKQS